MTSGDYKWLTFSLHKHTFTAAAQIHLELHFFCSTVHWKALLFKVTTGYHVRYTSGNITNISMGCPHGVGKTGGDFSVRGLLLSVWSSCKRWRRCSMLRWLSPYTTNVASCIQYSFSTQRGLGATRSVIRPTSVAHDWSMADSQTVIIASQSKQHVNVIIIAACSNSSCMRYALLLITNWIFTIQLLGQGNAIGLHHSCLRYKIH